MSKRILVPMEGSARDADALAMARHIAHQLSAAIVLIHVAPILFDTEEIIAAEQRLDAWCREMRAEGIEAHFAMEYGEPATEIAATARQQHAEMIVLAPDHRVILEPLWHPRISRGLLGRSNTPLFILPETPPGQAETALLDGPDAKVLLAVDGSANAEAALPLAIQLAQAYQRPLVLVRVVAPIFILGAGIEALEAQREARYAEEAKAHRYLVETRERVASEAHIPVETIELVGPVAEQLTHLAAARQGSILVMGTHGQTGLARVMVGSVAADAMRRATTPLLIVPSRQAQQKGNVD